MKRWKTPCASAHLFLAAKACYQGGGASVYQGDGTFVYQGNGTFVPAGEEQ